MTIFWSSWITILSIACWAAILGLLLFIMRNKPELKDDGTTGHSYDGIKEYDKTLPKWWLAMFFGSIVWTVGYWVFFPAIFPATFNGLATVTVDGKEVPWTSHNELASDLEKNDKIFTDSFQNNFLPNPEANKKLAELKALQDKRNQPEPPEGLQDEINEQITALAPYIEELTKNPKAKMAGQRLFLQNCALCHGSNAKGATNGATGYPNLTDDDWLHGGEPENILLTLHNGRNTAIDTSDPSKYPMPAQRDDIGEQGVRATAEYVLSISGNHNNYELDKTLVAQGKAIFSEKCTICHGQDAKGSIAAGAPNQTDNIWLFGGDRETIRESIRNGRLGVMPEWQTKLGNHRLMLLAAYVYSLSNNEMHTSETVDNTAEATAE